MAPRKTKTSSDEASKKAKPASRSTTKKKITKSKSPRYVATRVNIYHPFQKVLIGPPPGVQLDHDNWLDVQIERGLVEKVL
jgi:hypothetical protein